MDALLTVDAACYPTLLEATAERYRELLHVALAQLHQAQREYAALQAQHEALKDELRRAIRAAM